MIIGIFRYPDKDWEEDHLLAMKVTKQDGRYNWSGLLAGCGRADCQVLLCFPAARDLLLPDLAVTDQDVPAMRHAATLMFFRACPHGFFGMPEGSRYRPSAHQPCSRG